MALVGGKCMNCGKSFHVNRDDMLSVCPFCKESIETAKSAELYKVDKKLHRQSVREIILVAMVVIVGMIVFVYAYVFVRGGF